MEDKIIKADSGEKKTAKIEPNKNQNQTKKYNIMFRKNRKFDLHLKRRLLTFMGRESKIITEEEYLSDNFQQQIINFVVKGV